MTGRIEELSNEYYLDVRWAAFPLHPETPPEGRSLEALFAGQPIDIPAMLSRLKQVAREEGLPFGERAMTYNSRLAQELGKWAEPKGKGKLFHEAAFRAYFAFGRNLAETDVLVGIAESVGLPGDEARAVIEARSFRSAVDSDWQRSREFGITAVPTFRIEREVLVGAQPRLSLRRFVEAGGAARRERSMN